MSSNTKNRPNAKKNEEKKDNKLVIILAIIFAIVAVVIVGVVAFLLGRKESTNETDGREVGGTVRTVVDEESAANVMDQMRQEVEEGMFVCNMSMKWTFENGSAESQDAYVSNSENNTHPIYFDVYLDGSDEPIYSSPVLPVGTEITNFKLDKVLEAGDYEATVIYTLLKDVESQEELSRAGFVIKLTVLE